MFSLTAKRTPLENNSVFKRTSVAVLALFLGCGFRRCGVCKEENNTIVVLKMQRKQHTLLRRTRHPPNPLRGR